MFDDLLESTSQKKKTNKGWTVLVSTTRSGDDSGRSDFDPVDLHRGASQGDALDVARCSAASSASAASAAAREDDQSSRSRA